MIWLELHELAVAYIVNACVRARRFYLQLQLSKQWHSHSSYLWLANPLAVPPRPLLNHHLVTVLPRRLACTRTLGEVTVDAARVLGERKKEINMTSRSA